MIAIVDIDGTIADLSHRLHFIQSSPKDWDRFFDAMIEDTVIPGMRHFIWAVCAHYTLVYLTGRPESHRRHTMRWLVLHEFPEGDLVMRKVGDHRADTVVKAELYRDEVLSQRGDAKLAIEDRKGVVEMWRALGILTLQPKDGDY